MGSIGSGFWRAALAVLALSASAHAFAAPSRLIILRHGEKLNDYALCATGVQRSFMLRDDLLGRNAANSVLEGETPAAVLATTLHTLELATPFAGSWNLPVTTYSVTPFPGQTFQAFTLTLNEQSRVAVRDLMANPAWRGKTVVMVWEHVHIANEALEKQFAGQPVTLRQLLALDTLPEPDRSRVPPTWSGTNYNYFWIVDFNADGKPVRFQSVKQKPSARYPALPTNDWGKPEGLPPSSRCLRVDDVPLKAAPR